MKSGAKTMHIKASGDRLDALDSDHGHVAVDYRSLLEQAARIETENDYQHQLRSFTSGPGRASIETGFHALMGRVVIHSHSIYANVLTCARFGQQILADFFPDALFVPYATPGWEVTRLMKERLDGGCAPEVVFLQNHGLIVSGSTAERAIELHEFVNRDLMYRMGIETPPAMQSLRGTGANDSYIWPDQVVYADMPDSAAATETSGAARYVLAQQRRLGLETQWLEPEEIARLRWLESEKYRKKALAS